ncbi:hypothetical protein J132_06154 [Termitomyces sp. J132]|nr:hypothetical protein J132_06154 [Termitomyces sp. J132]
MLAVDDCEGFSSTIASAHGQSDPVSSKDHASAFFGSVLSHTLVATHTRRHKKRGSLSALIGILPKDQIQKIHDSDSDMLQDDERSTRKTFRENRLYRFITRSLTRSRSRSRSRAGRDTLPTVDLHEPVPDLPPSQNGRARLDSMGQSGPSKPVTRIPSRPLSSTTTATNTTITPTPPHVKKRSPSGIPVLKASTHKPETTRAPATRKKLHTLFGIPLSSPKKSSFTPSNHDKSRPSSPPLPGHDEFKNNDPTPKASSHSPQPHSRPASPSPAARPKPGHNPSNSSAGTSASGSSRLQKFFNGGQKMPSPPSADVVSTQIRGPSHRRGNSTSNSASNRSSPSPTPDIAPPKPKAVGLMRPPAMPPPHNVHVPPSPRQERSGPAPRIGKSSSRGHPSRTNSVDSSRGAEDVDGLGDLNGHIRVKTGHSHRQSHRSTKHGSFDFERPGWNTVMQRTASLETTGSGTSTTGTHLGRSLDGFIGGIRESVMGPGLAGVGTLQRDMSLKRGKERDEMIARIKEEERRRRRAEAQDKEKTTAQEFGLLPSKSQSLSPTTRTLSPEDDRAPATGKHSSWSKKHGTFPEKAKVTTLGASLGPFEFEPPVSPPAWSATSTGNGHSNCKDVPLTVSWASEKGRDKSRTRADLKRDKEKRVDMEKERRAQSARRGDRAPEPVPVPVTSASMGYRSGMKGRSLDLGLGLSWAPSSVREDALLPSSVLMSRSVSGSSSHASRSVGKSFSGSTSGHGTSEESSVLASEVAKVFKSTLDDMGFKTFQRYIDRFDAREIPIDGPTGIVTRVERLLASTSGLSEEDKRQLLENFIQVVLQHA